MFAIFFLPHHIISLHRKGQPTRKTMDPQSNTYKKDDYCDAIVLLYKGQITEVSLLSV